MKICKIHLKLFRQDKFSMTTLMEEKVKIQSNIESKWVDKVKY
jgi:hypothetical protein